MQNSNQQYWKKIEALLKLSHKQLFFNDLHLKKKKTQIFLDHSNGALARAGQGDVLYLPVILLFL